MQTLRFVALAALLAYASSTLDADAWLNPEFRRNLIVEVGAAAYEHHSVPCNPKVVGSVAACFNQNLPAVGNNDYQWGSPQISYPTDGAPWGVHLTGPYPDGRTYLVSWYTGAPTVGPNLTKPDTSRLKATAAVTPANGGSTKRFTGSVITYLRAYTDPASANYQYLSPRINHVVLSRLAPATTYSYQLSTSAGQPVGNWSFTTLPLRTYPLRIGLMGDVGQTLNSSDTRDHMMDSRPQVVIHVGDNSYADNYNSSNPNVKDGRGSNQNRWDSHAVMWEPLMSSVPVLNCVGNHELEMVGIPAVITYATSTFTFPTNYPFQSYAARFPVPGTTSPNFGNITSSMYYSTVIGGVATLITLNNLMPFQQGSKQYEWAVAEFKKVDRKKTPWLLVQFHSPPYHSYFVHYKEMDCFMSIWEDIFYQYGVDMVFNGHVHAYERTHPMYKYQPDTCGPIYVTIGDGGNVEGPYRNYVDEINPATNKTFCEALSYNMGPNEMAASNPSGWGPPYQRMLQPPKCPTVTFQPAGGVGGGPPLVLYNATAPGAEPVGFCQSSQPLWSAYRDPSFGHAVLELQSDTVAHFQWFKNLEGNKVAVDEVVLQRMSACPNRAAGTAAGSRRARMMA